MTIFRPQFLLLSLALSLCSSGCTLSKQAQVGVTEALIGNQNQSYDWGEFVCYEGPVCAQLELVRVQISDENENISVRLRNRTPKNLALQLSLEWLSEKGATRDQTRFHDLPIAPHQESEIVLHGPNAPAKSLRIIVRDRRAL